MFDVVKGDEVRLGSNKNQSPSVSRAASPHVVPGITKHLNNPRHLSTDDVVAKMTRNTHLAELSECLAQSNNTNPCTQFLPRH